MERLVGLKIEVTDCSSRYLSKHVDSYANLFYNVQNRSVKKRSLCATTACVFHQNFVAMASLIALISQTNLHVSQKAVATRNAHQRIGYAQIMNASLTRKCVTVKWIAAMGQTKRIVAKVSYLCIVYIFALFVSLHCLYLCIVYIFALFISLHCLNLCIV